MAMLDNGDLVETLNLPSLGPIPYSPLRTTPLSPQPRPRRPSAPPDKLAYSTDEEDERRRQATGKGMGKKKVRWQAIGEGIWGGGVERRWVGRLPGPDGEVEDVPIMDGMPPHVRELWDVREWVGDLKIVVVGSSGVGKTA